MEKLIKSKLVLVEVPDDKRDDVIGVLRSELGIMPEDAERILDRLPKELLSSVPYEAAELVANSLKKAGAKVEVVAESGKFCEAHPHKLARARCKKCGKYICEIEILNAKRRLLCADCYEKLNFRKRLAVILGVLALIIASVAYAALKPVLKKASKKLQPMHTYSLAFVCFANGSDPQRLEVFNRIGMPDVADPKESLYAIPKLFAREFARHTGMNHEVINADVLGVFMVDPSNPPPPGLKEGELRAYLVDMLRSEGIDPDDYELFVFVFLCKYRDLPSDSFHDIVSAVDKFALVYYPTDRPKERGYYLAATAWAVARLLGAKPKSPSSPREIPKDIAQLVNPRDKRYSFAEISYGLKLRFPEHTLVPVSSLSEVRVGYQTAYELGWTSRSLLKKFERRGR